METANLFVPCGASLETHPAREGGPIVITTSSREELSVWQDGGRLHSCPRKRHHVVFDSGIFVALTFGWQYATHTEAGWSWWRAAVALVTAIVRAGGGAVSTAQGGGGVDLRMVVRKRDLPQLGRMLLAIGRSPVVGFEDALKAAAISAGAAYLSAAPDGGELRYVWSYFPTPESAPETPAESGPAPAFSLDETRASACILVQQNGAVIAALPRKWFALSGGTVGIRLGGHYTAPGLREADSPPEIEFEVAAPGAATSQTPDW